MDKMNEMLKSVVMQEDFLVIDFRDKFKNKIFFNFGSTVINNEKFNKKLFELISLGIKIKNETDKEKTKLPRKI